MVCTPIKLEGGMTAIVCCGRGRKRRCACERPATLLCDWKVGKGKTCDRPICTGCAKEVAHDKHLCREHQVAYRDWIAARGTR